MPRPTFPIHYDMPLFRPPSEADSLILQITYGCSWNQCAFCEMYTTKNFRIRRQEEILKEINDIAEHGIKVDKVFLADGNPMVLSTGKLLSILDAINKFFPGVDRISTYALPSNISSKTPDKLKQLREAGLKMVYVGIESGDDEVLKMAGKGETHESTVKGLLMAKEAGIFVSAIILNGLGGLKYSRQHAVHSAEILNEFQPEFASALVLSFPFGLDRYKQRFNGEYIPMSIVDLLKEMELFIAHTRLENTVFRSNHASNYLVLKGILPTDKDDFLKRIKFAYNNPDIAGLRPEWLRGL